MSQLEDIESALVTRIAETYAIGGHPLLAVVRGTSGSLRAATQEELLREQMPAAYVAFTDQSTAPDVFSPGPRFSVYVATRSLRLTSNPRFGDAESRGAYDVIEALRARLDNFPITQDAVLQPIHVRFVAADDRSVIYELQYRALLAFGSLLFGEVRIGGTASLTTRPLAPPVDAPGLRFTLQPDGTYEVRNSPITTFDAPDGSLLVWRGEFRAADSSALDDLVVEVNELRELGTEYDLTDHRGRVYPGMFVARYLPLSPRYVDPFTSQYVQECEIAFKCKGD